jgi:hypothetical protein
LLILSAAGLPKAGTKRASSPFRVGLRVTFSQRSLNAQLPRNRDCGDHFLPDGTLAYWNPGRPVCVTCQDLSTLVQTLSSHTNSHPASFGGVFSVCHHRLVYSVFTIPAYTVERHRQDVLWTAGKLIGGARSPARKLLNGGSSVLDVSRTFQTAARVYMDGAIAVPPADFDLHLSDGRVFRSCRIAWRQVSSLGVSFSQPSVNAA